MKTNKIWSVMTILVMAIGTVTVFCSCGKDRSETIEKCECGGDCHGTKCSAPCASDCKCTKTVPVMENIITIDDEKIEIESVEVKSYMDNIEIEFGNRRNRIYCMLDFYGTSIPTGNNIKLRCLEVEDEANHKLGGGTYDGEAFANVSRDGNIYTVVVNNQTIDDDEKRHTVSLSYKGILQ